MITEWKPIEETGCNYSVSSSGGIMNNKTGRILSTPVGSHGYTQVTLFKRTYFVHRLVAKYFLEKVDGLDFVNHKDEDRTNSCVENLEWCTHQYNSEYSCSKHYHFTSPDGDLVEVFNLRKFCRDNNLTPQLMSHVHSGKRPHHKQWRKYYDHRL